MLEVALWIGLVLAARPAAADPAVELPLQAAARAVGEDQGVFAQAADGTLLAAQAADRAVHPASVTKIATSLALLERLGPAYRFETQVLAGGPVRDGRLDGDLIVDAGGDPTLVYENVFLLLAHLRALGLREVTGKVSVVGPLLFNWKPDPAGNRVQLALAGRDGTPAWTAVRALLPPHDRVRLRDAGLAFDGDAVAGDAAARTLAVQRSPPLVRILKWLNDYSNNVFHLVSERIGGPAKVERVARARVPPEMRGEVVIDNAAGSGESNRLSPRAAVAILVALERELARSHLSLVDALPVSGVDLGTLAHRVPEQPAIVVGKTGTFGDVGASGLVGMVRTRRWGRVGFAVLNSWIPAREARRRQDAFVRALVEAGGGMPWDYRPTKAAPFTEATLEEAAGAARRVRATDQASAKAP
jgi:D-alanyl-D-alanine carboxypeptidase/D-alanyl-D-alanine-endopeptidase (penicillin-binding protein 4)